MVSTTPKLLIESRDHPASYVVYYDADSAKYYAKSCIKGGTDYNDPDATVPILNAVSSGGTIVIKKATYSIKKVSLGANLGLVIPSNTKVLAEPGTVFTQPGTDYLGSVGGVDTLGGFFVNSDPVNGNSNIEIAGIQFVGNPPDAPNNNYSNLCYFRGVSNLSIHDIVQDGVGMTIRPLTSEMQTSQQPIVGHCVGVSVRRITLQNSCPYGIAIQHAARVAIRDIVAPAQSSIDDIILIGDSVQNATIEQCYLDKTMTVGGHSTTTGRCIAINGNSGAWGLSNLLVDHVEAIGVPTGQPCILYGGVGIQRNITFRKLTLESGLRGLYALAGSGGTAECWTFRDITARFNNQQGIQIEASALLNGLYVDHNQIYNNGKLGSGQQFGLALTTQVSPGMRRVFVHDNAIYDDGTGTQTQCIRFDGSGTYDTLMNIHDNSFNQTAFGQLPVGIFTRVRNNQGYNPVGLIASPYDNTNNWVGVGGGSATLTSAKIYTCITTPLDIYFTAGTVSALTKNASTIPYNSALTVIHLEPGDTFSITFTVTPTTQLVFGQ